MSKWKFRYPLEKQCVVCGKHFTVQTACKNRNTTCSSECGNKRASQTRSGENHWNWQGGIKKEGKGYMMRLVPNHPFATKQGYVLAHRLVMERQLGRYLRPTEIVHHKNRIKDDNRVENLELKLSQKAHFAEHIDEIKVAVKNANTGVRRSIATEFKKGQVPHNYSGLLIKCAQCGKEKHYPPSTIKKGKGKFCSRQCAFTYRDIKTKGEI